MSRSTYALTWVAEGIGDQPETLFAFPDTAQPQRLAESTRRAADELERAGLYDRQRGRLHPDLLAAYRLLARPEVEFFGEFAHQQHSQPFSALVAASGGQGVLAILDAESLALHPVRPDVAAEALLGVMPPMAPAHGQSVTVPASAVDGRSARPASDDEEFSVFARQGPVDPAVDRLKRLTAVPRIGAARFHAAVRDGYGRRRRGEFPVNVVDLESGRWFFHRQRNSGGEVWLTAAPAIPYTVATKLYETCRSLWDAR